MNSEFLNGTARDEHDSRLRGHFCKNTRSMVSTVNFGMNNIIIENLGDSSQIVGSTVETGVT